MTIKPYLHYTGSEILPLYQAVGWGSYYEHPEMLQKAWEGSLCILGAYEGDTLVGVIRAVGDGHSIVFIQDLLVRPEYQRRGIGTRLVEALLERYAHVYQIQLTTDDEPKTVAFYRSLGFRPIQELGCCGFCRLGGADHSRAHS